MPFFGAGGNTREGSNISIETYYSSDFSERGGSKVGSKNLAHSP